MSSDRAAADLVLATSLGEANGGPAVAAAVGVALSRARPSVLVAELGATGRRGPTMLAAGAARELEDSLRSDGFERAAARCVRAVPVTAPPMAARIAAQNSSTKTAATTNMSAWPRSAISGPRRARGSR